MTNNLLVAGLKEDFDELIRRFLLKETLRYPEFSATWREMKFDLIFCGHPKLAEAYEFCEEAVSMAADLFFSGSTWPQTVAALYLLHTLRRVHPGSRLCSVRAPLQRTRALRGFQQTARDNGDLDALFVLCSMMRDGVFRIVATEREHGPDRSLRKYLKPVNEPLDHPPVKEVSVKDELIQLLRGVDPAREGGTNGALSDMDAVAKAYCEIKCLLPGGSGSAPCRSLDFITKDLGQRLSQQLTTEVLLAPPLVLSRKQLTLSRKAAMLRLKKKKKSRSQKMVQSHSFVEDDGRKVKEEVEDKKKEEVIEPKAAIVNALPNLDI